MALPAQLKAARASDATTASTIDNVIGALETAIADIFGFTLDVDITASPFTLNNSGQITKALVAQRAAGPVGWRFRDTTSGVECRIVVNGLNLDFDENTGSEGSPAWTNRLRMVVSSGALTGAAATSARMGLCPQGDGNTAHFLNGNLAWTTPSSSTPPSARVRHSSNQALSSGSLVTLAFDTEDFDASAMHSTVTNNSRITIATAGKYLVIGQGTFAANADGSRRLQILQSGAYTIGRSACLPAASDPTSIEVRTVVSLVAGDYIQLQAYQSSGVSLNLTTNASYSPVLSVAKIG